MRADDSGNADGHKIVLRGKSIREDSNGHINLDDIWEAAKARPTRKPANWRCLPTTKRLAEELQKKITKSALEANTSDISVAYAKRGRGNTGTYAHPILAAAYAGYLSPKLEIEVREVWLRYRRGDATLADEILQRATAEENHWVGVRAMSRSRRKNFTDTLRDHGVHGAGYAICTNTVYQQLLDSTAAELKEARGVPKKGALRDFLATDELSFVMAAEVLATDRINEEDRRGNKDCAFATSRSAGFIREAIERDKKDRQPTLLK